MNGNDDHEHPLTHGHPGDSHTADRYDKYKAEKQLEHAIGGSHEILARATTVFPFTLFPDTITVDRTKLTIAHRVFFSVAEVMSIPIEDILNVTVSVGPFFGSLKIYTRFFDPKEAYEIDWLWRDDARKLKRIVQGYVIALQQKVDSSALTTGELAKTLDKLGQGSPDD